MGVAKNINCYHLLDHLLSQAVLLMSLVQISHYCHYCHHQLCLLHHQICHTCCHTLFRCCVNLCNIVFMLYWSVCFLTIGLYHQFVLLLIQLGTDKNNQLIRSVYCCTELACTFLCSWYTVQTGVLECFYNKLRSIFGLSWNLVSLIGWVFR